MSESHAACHGRGEEVGTTRARAASGVLTLIQRFGSAANLNIHLRCLVLDGVYRNCDGAAVFHEAAAPSTDELEAVLLKIITRIMRLLTRLGFVIEEPDRTYLAETATDGALRSLQAPRAPIGLRWGPHEQVKNCLPCKACRAKSRRPPQSCVSTRTALACMRRQPCCRRTRSGVVAR